MPNGYKTDLVMFRPDLKNPAKKTDTQNGHPELPEMARQRLLLNIFPATKWLWLGFSFSITLL
jgi:hypothetical protein